MIKNTRRPKQIDEFIDKHHKVSTEFYEFMDNDLSNGQVKRAMKKFIEEDPLYFEPYLVLIDLFLEEGNYLEAKKYLKTAFQKAIMKIVDKKGNWPKIMEWGWLENRHVIKIIERWGIELWEEGNTKEALNIFENLLKTNPRDNIGARYSILAIKMNLNTSYELQFQSSLPGFIDAGEITKWFEENSRKFSDDFDWWWKEIEKVEYE